MPVGAVLERLVPETAHVDPGDLGVAQYSGETPHEGAVDSHQLLGRHHVRLVQTNPASNLRHLQDNRGLTVPAT